jgi:hypothetical protein
MKEFHAKAQRRNPRVDLPENYRIEVGYLINFF